MARPLQDLLARRVLFVTGKGGTGKSTIAAALAVIARDAGKRTLLVDVDGRGDAARYLGAGPSGYKAKEAERGLWHLSINPEDALDEYLRASLRLPRLYRIGPVSKVFDFIATAAPGVEEVLIAGKIGFEERAREGSRARWDIIVVDAAPSGQVLSHIRGPRTLTEMVRVGVIRSQTDWIRDVLEDPKRTGIVVVSLPEETPVTETEELVERTPKEVNTPVLALVANRIVRDLHHAATLNAIGAARDAVSAALGGPIEKLIGPAMRAANLLHEIAHSQAPHLERLRAIGLPVLEVLALPLGRHTRQATQSIAAALRESAA